MWVRLDGYRIQQRPVSVCSFVPPPGDTISGILALVDRTLKQVRAGFCA